MQIYGKFLEVMEIIGKLMEIYEKSIEIYGIFSGNHEQIYKKSIGNLQVRTAQGGGSIFKDSKL